MRGALLAEVEKGVREGLIETGMRLVEDIRKSMIPGTGKTYKWKGGSHTSSEPGQPPSPLTYRLHDSISYATTFGDKSGVGARAEDGDAIKEPKRAMGGYAVSVGSNAPYALSLEQGDKGKGIKARPYMWPALYRGRQIIKDAFTRF